jgi:hypothetical protein
MFFKYVGYLVNKTQFYFISFQKETKTKHRKDSPSNHSTINLIIYLLKDFWVDCFRF